MSGFNVYPNEIEGVVAMHPGVLECAAVGVPDDKSGEAVKLFVVKKDEALTAEDADQALPRAPHRLQVPARRRVPHRAAEDQRRQDPAPRAARRRRRRRVAGTEPAALTLAVTRIAAGRSPCCASCRCRRDVNQHGDIFGGWIMSQVDIAGGILAARRARGRVATVAVNSFQFKQPVLVGDVVTFFAEVVAHRAHVDHRRRRGVCAAQSPGGSHRQGHRGDADLRRGRRGSPAARAACRVTVCRAQQSSRIAEQQTAFRLRPRQAARYSRLRRRVRRNQRRGSMKRAACVGGASKPPTRSES